MLSISQAQKLAATLKRSYLTVHSLLAPLFSSSPDIIGIDGLDGCRKSSLAVRLSGHIGLKVVSLDRFLDKNKGTYVEHIDLDNVRAEVQGNRAIIEGVCLLKVMQKAGLSIDLAIYVQRLHQGRWADEDWLGLEQDVDEHLRRINQSAEWISGGSIESSDDGLVGEIIRYHHDFRPHEKADLTFCWNDG